MKEKLDKKPNIFDCGTTELSQDAIICYICSWADKNYESYEEHSVSKEFIKNIIEKSNFNYNKKIETVKATTQYKNIDVVIEINTDLIIVVENKKGTQSHNDQLQRYKEIAKEDYKNKQHIFVYIQSVIEAKDKQGNSEDYTYIGFNELLEIVEKSKCNNNIFNEYFDFLENHKNLHDQWENTAIESGQYGLDWYKTYGLYKELENSIGGSWGYVSNRSGGTQWFYISNSKQKLDGKDFYLQLERDHNGLRLIVKTYDNWGKDKRLNLLKKLQAEAKSFGIKKIEKAVGRFKSGTYESTAHIYLNGDMSIPINDDGYIDFEELVAGIKNSIELLNKIK